MPTTGAFHNADATVSARAAVGITPADGTFFPTTRALYIGTGGNLTVYMADGNAVSFTNVAQGIFPVQVQCVAATGTTASGIVALY